MGVWSVILAAIAYMAIGSILSGFCHDRDYAIYYSCLWPVIVALTIIYLIIDILSAIGEKLRELLDKEEV